MKNKKLLFITHAAAIAALYVVLTVASGPLASYSPQVRFSEALCVIAAFTPAAIPGLFIGCALANLVTQASVFDIVFGSLATLIGAVGTYLLRNVALKVKWAGFVASIPPIVANTIIIPFVLVYAFKLEGTLIYHAAWVALGEIISCGIIGTGLFYLLKRYGHKLGFKTKADFENKNKATADKSETVE